MARRAHGSSFDVIVIGSGMGGLAAAALLARLRGRRVLVLERHWEPGGFTHAFARPGGFRWDVGVHYVGDAVLKPGLPGDAFRVATGGAVRWRKMEDPFERLVFPGFELEIRSGREAFLADLVRAFPAEERAIRDWLRDVEWAASVTGILAARSLTPAPVQAVLELALRGRLRLASTTTGAYLAAHIRDPRLRAVLGARWGDYGPPPGQSAFLAHAVITRHYLEGGYYPEGTAGSIAAGATRVIESAGGKVRARAEVERIRVRGGRVEGVVLAGGEEIRAPVVVSDAGARNTYLRLLPEEVEIPFRDRLRVPTGMAVVVLYLGLSRSPGELGIRGENLWLHRTLDHDEIWARRAETLEGRPLHAYVSFPSAKDPASRAHTAEVISVVDPAAFAAWRDAPWRRRGPEYEALKARIAEGLLDLVEERLPGFRTMVARKELSTPLSSEYFTGHPGGESYGIPCTPERVGMRFLQARTPVRGLFLAGADALLLGVIGATMGGLMAAAAAEGPALIRDLRRAAREVTASGPSPTRSATSPSSA